MREDFKYTLRILPKAIATVAIALLAIFSKSDAVAFLGLIGQFVLCAWVTMDVKDGYKEYFQ